MSVVSDVLFAYREAWSRRRAFAGLYLALRLMTFAVLAPLMGVVINLAVSLSSQTALTDQDIAGFVLTPVGFVATVAVLSLLLLVEVLGFALMTAIWRGGGQSDLKSMRGAVHAVARRWRPLLQFAVLFVLRVLVLAAPFVVLGLGAFLLLLTDYDINYYLTHHPPEAFVAGAIIAALVLGLAVLLLLRLTGWALALHLVLFDQERPNAAFDRSASLMAGQRFGLQRRIVIWLLIRIAALSLVALIAGLGLNLVPFDLTANLRRVLIVALAVAALWVLARLVLSGIALGALTRLVDACYDGGTVPAPLTDTSAVGLRARLAVAGGVGVAVIAAGFWISAELLDDISTEDQVEIIAHRGAAGSRPENTLASVQKAMEDRADWVEIDVQETADGQVVVVHDSDFMKLAGVDLKIWDATMADLADIDIGGWFDPAYSDQRTPLLRDVLKLAKDRAKVLIELKYYGHNEQLEARVVEIVEDMGMQGQIATMSLKYPLVQEMLALRPDWPSGVLAATAVGDLSGLDGDFVAVNSGQASAWLADSLKASGKSLYVWTVNDPLAMSKMISMGADGLITDEPALARQVLEFRAGLSTAERLALWLVQELGVSLNEKRYRDVSP